jgi:hypothetical protein
MYIIVGQDHADALKDSYILLELENKAFCVVIAEQIPIQEIPQLEEHQALHAKLLTEYTNKNYGICRQYIVELMGKFGGEADSFYQTLLDRINILINN